MQLASHQRPSSEWLFFQNATQVQLHGGKNPIVLWQEIMLQFELHVSIEPAEASLQQFNWSVPPPETWNFLEEHLGHVRGVPPESFVFREGELTSYTVARKLQQAQCWRAAQIAASFPGTIQWGFYHREAALESRSGKIATQRYQWVMSHLDEWCHIWMSHRNNATSFLSETP